VLLEAVVQVSASSISGSWPSVAEKWILRRKLAPLLYRVLFTDACCQNFRERYLCIRMIAGDVVTNKTSSERRRD
jgi:hypothetical protein